MGKPSRYRQELDIAFRKRMNSTASHCVRIVRCGIRLDAETASMLARVKRISALRVSLAASSIIEFVSTTPAITSELTKFKIGIWDKRRRLPLTLRVVIEIPRSLDRRLKSISKQFLDRAPRSEAFRFLVSFYGVHHRIAEVCWIKVARIRI